VNTRTTSGAGDPYNAELKWTTIKVPEPGRYRISYYIQMVCNSTLCDTSDDYINVEVKTDAGIQVANYGYKNIEYELRWLQKYIDVDTTNMNIEVSISSLPKENYELN
jgi:hypothetical protein